MSKKRAVHSKGWQRTVQHTAWHALRVAAFPRHATDPNRGTRVGEASHPGPTNRGGTSPARELARPHRDRALRALADLRLVPEPGTTDAETLSDTLSATTARASPPASPRAAPYAQQRRARVFHALAQMQLAPAHAPRPDAVPPVSPTRQTREGSATPYASPAGSPRSASRPGEAAPTQLEVATPGFTPPPSPTGPARPTMHRWQNAHPPDSPPGDRNSWLFVPLLHAASGNLSEAARAAWSSLPHDAGVRFDGLAVTLREAPPIEPGRLARLLQQIAAYEAQEAGAPQLQSADVSFATSLLALPEAPIPLAAALLLAVAPDGYVSAAAQSALLEAYGGTAVAAAATTLADGLRTAAPAPGPGRRRRQRTRRRVQTHQPTHAHDSDSAHTDVPECPPPATAGPRGWEQLDGIDC